MGEWTEIEKKIKINKGSHRLVLNEHVSHQIKIGEPDIEPESYQINQKERNSQINQVP